VTTTGERETERDSTNYSRTSEAWRRIVQEMERTNRMPSQRKQRESILSYLGGEPDAPTAAR
jgi:hypothetical protein